MNIFSKIKFFIGFYTKSKDNNLKSLVFYKI